MITVTKTKPVVVALKGEPSQRKEEKITLKALKDAIPADCFESSVVTSFAYLFRDIAYAAGLVYLALHIDDIENTPARYACWALYTLLQGFVLTGIWIIGHECGHGAFSKYPALNDVVGWLTHSSLMVPFFSWKITHARHHRYHNNMDKDVVFVPWTEKNVKEHKNNRWHEMFEMVEDTPAYTLAALLLHQLLGWQTYLLFNISAGPKSLPENGGKGALFKNASHFDPFGELFTPFQRLQIAASDLGLILMGLFLYGASFSVGLRGVILLYVIPYMWVHHWLIAITYLHHTHPNAPHYNDETWNFTDGALSTIDRSLGFVGRHFFHEIIDYHVVHHLFTKIPFYHAERATKAIMPLLGNKYIESKDEWFLVSLYNTFRQCRFVTDLKSNGVLHWSSTKSQ